jgi:hypothetical protein
MVRRAEAHKHPQRPIQLRKISITGDLNDLFYLYDLQLCLALDQTKKD